MTRLAPSLHRAGLLALIAGLTACQSTTDAATAFDRSMREDRLHHAIPIYESSLAAIMVATGHFGEAPIGMQEKSSLIVVESGDCHGRAVQVRTESATGWVIAESLPEALRKPRCLKGQTPVALSTPPAP